MRNNQPISIQPTALPSIYTNDTSYIGEPEAQQQPATLFPTRTGRIILVNMPAEPVFTSFH